MARARCRSQGAPRYWHQWCAPVTFLPLRNAFRSCGLPQGHPKSAQPQPLGEPLVDELLQDSFLRRLSTQFFQMLHEERTQVIPSLAEQVRARRRGGTGGELAMV